MQKKHGETILVIGAFNFIASLVVKRILDESDHEVVGVVLPQSQDIYDVRYQELLLSANSKGRFTFYNTPNNALDYETLEQVFQQHQPTYVLSGRIISEFHKSSQDKNFYLNGNHSGLLALLELSQKYKVKHFVFSSSCRVYNQTGKRSFSENDATSCPISFLGAVSSSMENIIHSYAYEHTLPCTSFRLFSTYGSYMNPEKRLRQLISKVDNEEVIKLDNRGQNITDYIYKDDATNIVYQILWLPPDNYSNFRLLNVGTGFPTSEENIIHTLEELLNKRAKIKFSEDPSLKKQYCYVANTRLVEKLLGGYKPKTTIEHGLKDLLAWYLTQKAKT
jgi:nucleoside-diphosphate-sugar epimerase